ncbi:MAG: hypothetical protein DDT20_01119 [Firmicutes bacterium]|nr:hypothetical protein [Bacillota bacterium]
MSIASSWLASTWQTILADLVQELEALLERTQHVNQAIRDSLSQLLQSLTTIPGLNSIFAATIILRDWRHLQVQKC